MPRNQKKSNMNTYSCLLCLGSNFERDLHMETARRVLKEHFLNIRFGEEMETEAIGDGILSPFSNQLAKFESSLSPEEIRNLLKRIELDNGRTSEDRSKGIVRLDIDLLIYGDHVLKPEDLKRAYIQKSLMRF